MNRLIRNQLTEGRFTEEQAFDLDITAFPGFNIIAVNKDKDYVYVARRNDSDLQLERYDLTTGYLDGWVGSAQLPSGTANGQYALSISTQPVNSSYSQIRLDLHPLDTATVTGSGQPTALRVQLSEFGGDAELSFFTPERIVADRFIMPTASTSASGTSTSAATPQPTPTTPPIGSYRAGDVAGAFFGGVAATTAAAAGCGIAGGCAYKHRNVIKKKWKHRHKNTPHWKQEQATAEQGRLAMQQGTNND